MFICEWQKALLLTSWMQYIISWHFLFKNLKDKPSFFVCLVLMKTLEYRNRFFSVTNRNYFLVLWTEVIALHYNTSFPLFWERKNIQNVGYWFKASWLLSKLPNFLPKLRPGAFETRLLVYKKCVFIFCNRTS